MQADFDLSQFDDIPDVVEPALRAPSPSVDLPPAAHKQRSPRASALGVHGRTRSELFLRRGIALLITFVWLTFQVFMLGPRTDFARLGVGFSLVQIALPFVLSLILLATVLSPGPAGLGLSSNVLTGAVVVAVGGMAAVVLFYPLPFAYAPPPGSMTFGQWALVCGDIVAMMAALPIALSVLTFRHAFVTAAPHRTAALGGACALFAVTAMHLHCENIDPLHSALGHMVPAVALTMISAWVLFRFTRS
jgi:Negative regulator of sigma F